MDEKYIAFCVCVCVYVRSLQMSELKPKRTCMCRRKKGKNFGPFVFGVRRFLNVRRVVCDGKRLLRDVDAMGFSVATMYGHWPCVCVRSVHTTGRKRKKVEEKNSLAFNACIKFTVFFLCFFILFDLWLFSFGKS